MTLLFAKLPPEVTTVSDVAISSKAAGSENHVYLPMKGRPIAFTAAEGSRLVRLSQKTTIFGNIIFQWAGSYVVALAVAKAVFEQSQGGTLDIDIGEVIDSLTLNSSERESVSFAYFFNNEGYVDTQYWGCRVGSTGEDNFVVQGSGLWDWLIDTKAGLDFDSILCRTVMHLVGENWTNRNYDFLYGGWFEFGGLNDGLKWEKFPYALKFYHMSEKGLQIHLPVVYSTYVGEELFITSIRVQEGAIPDVKISQITDFLGRDSKEAGDIVQQGFFPPWRPAHLFHVLITEDSDKIGVFKESENQSMTLVLEGNQPVGFEFKEDFLDMLLSKQKGDFKTLMIEKDNY